MAKNQRCAFKQCHCNNDVNEPAAGDSIKHVSLRGYKKHYCRDCLQRVGWRVVESTTTSHLD
jgi:hypothetical protein